MMASCNVVLRFESVDKIEWCDHSPETSSAIVLFVYFTKTLLYKNEILTKTVVL